MRSRICGVTWTRFVFAIVVFGDDDARTLGLAITEMAAGFACWQRMGFPE